MRKERVAIDPKASSSKSCGKYTVKTGGANLHVRSGNSTSHRVIGKMANKTVFEGIEEKGGWVKHNKIGKLGWSSRQYLTKDSKSSSKGSSSNKSNPDKEETILTGVIKLREPKADLKAKTGIELQGLGKRLSGVYFVDKVTHNFNRDGGYSQSVNVSRKWVGQSIKGGSGGSTKKPSTPAKKPTSNKTPVKPKSNTKTYTIKKGDTLWAIAKRYYGKGADYVKIYNANKSKIKNPNLIYPGQVIKIP